MIIAAGLVASLVLATPIEAAVSRLGPRSDIAAVEEVARYGCQAVPYLARQLHVTNVRQINFSQSERHPEEMRIIWSIAALRYISGQDFHATQESRGNPDSARYQMLRIGAPAGSTKFFGIWMSRGTTYFASPHEQKKIIDGWRRYSSSGICKPSGEKRRDILFWLYGVSR